jgi:beta-lactamase regulating signal transducer with metallopeptidase domain
MDMRDTWIDAIDAINRAGQMHWDFASAMFVQVLALVAILGLVELSLRRRVRPVVRYWLWGLVVLKLLLPVTLRTPASAAYWVVSEAPATANHSVPQVDASSVAQSTAILPEMDPRPLEGPADRQFVSDPPKSGLPHESQVAAIPAREAPPNVAAPPPLPSVNAYGWLFLTWCGGCLVLGGIVLRRAAKVRRLVQAAGEAPREFGPPLEVACALFQLSSRRIRVKISEQVGCPAVCGFWRPTILIPQRLVGRLDEEQLQLVFVHELAHWKRWDLQLNLLQTLLQVVYFYNLAVWIANFVLRRLREEAVDDAVLVALAAPVERYSHTLLDVAAHAARPLELNVRLIGILESRKALANRIQRLATSPLPKSARLGLWGFAGVVIIGVVLLPMAGSRRVVADHTAENTAQQQASPPTTVAATASDNKTDSAETASPATAPVLAGRIIDEKGQPVSDAIVRVMNVANRGVQETATKRDGHFAFDHVWFAGEHAVFIHSDRCIGFTRLGDCPRVVLDSRSPVVRDFRLKIACQLRVQTLDEEGHPVPDVQLFKVEPNNPYQANTDHQGWMTIGGLVPAEYVIALASKDFVPALLIVKIESPQAILERKVVLKRGVPIKGTSFYSDGKPVLGGRVVAVPSWWQPNWFPFNEPVQADGSFVLRHIGSGRYDVMLSVPRRVELWPRLDNVLLVGRPNPLSLNINAPSPDSAVLIKGHLRFIGGKPRHSVSIMADSASRSSAVLGYFEPGDQDAFQVGPLAKGEYTLTFLSPEIDTKRVVGVTAPSNDIQVDIRVTGLIALRGVVDVLGAKGRRPAGDFRIRMIKLGELHGSTHNPINNWQGIYNPKGEFTVEFPGLGLYAVEATADGFATVRSDPINTDHLPKDPIRITLNKGASLAGSVVDEEGLPIDGAIVMSLAKAGGQLPLSLERNVDAEIGVRSVAGRFQFDGLSPGTDTLQVMHSDFALTTVRGIEIPGQGQVNVGVVMKRGGTVRGHVRDERGRTVRGAALQFRRYPEHFAGERYNNQFASAVTDANGYYEVRHLPDEIVHIVREPRSSDVLGVSHLAVLPQTGKTRTVDFGAGAKLSGQLFINGAPLASTRLQLVTDNRGFRDFAATTMTDEEGAFVFTGVPFGTRYLYYSAERRKRTGDDWVRVRSLEINTAARDLGRIDHRVGKVTVKVVGRLKDDTPANLCFYDPNLFQVHIAAEQRRARAEGAPYVFENVGPGKYDIHFWDGERRASINQMLVVTPQEPNPTVTVEWPKGTAFIHGTVDAPLRKLIGDRLFVLASPDQRWQGFIRFDDRGRFELRSIPAGEYSLILLRWAGGNLPVTLKRMRLADGDARTLDLTKADIPQSELAKEAVRVSVFTPEGIPLPGCEIRLAGSRATSPLPKPTRTQGATKWFALPPGSYTFVASYLGAESAPQTAEVRPVLKDGAWITHDHVVNLTLAPIE